MLELSERVRTEEKYPEETEDGMASTLKDASSSGVLTSL